MGERATRGKGFRVANVNWGFERSASYQQVTSKLEGVVRWGDKSGIWRFYRRVWKNIFYERRDKEKRDGVFGGMEERSYIFLKFFWGVEENSKFYGGMYFWDYGVGFLGYVGEGMIYGIFLNGMFPIKCNSRITFYGRRLGKFHPSADSSNCKVR